MKTNRISDTDEFVQMVNQCLFQYPVLAQYVTDVALSPEMKRKIAQNEEIARGVFGDFYNSGFAQTQIEIWQEEYGQ